jgi:hypothetical protein
MKCNLFLVTVAIIAGERGCKTQYDFERRSQVYVFCLKMCPITVEIISYKDFRLFITDCRVILIL